MRSVLVEIPRWLLVLVVVLIVLAGGSCSVGVLRGDDGDSATDIPGFLKDLSPEPPPIPPAELTTDCPLAGSRLTFAGRCSVTIEPSGEFRRRLRLRHAGGAATIVVDYPRSDEPLTVSLPGDDPIDIIAGRDERIEIDLNCEVPTCRVDLR